MNEPYSKNAELTKISLLGVGLTNEKEEEILEYIITSLKKKSEKYYIVTPNPEILVYASKHDNFRDILNNAKIALIDGIGIVWASKILGKGVKQRITGADFVEKLCNTISTSNVTVAEKPITVGFLGGRQKIAELTAERLVDRCPRLKVNFVGEEWRQEGFVLASKRRKTQNKTQKNAEEGFSEVQRTIQHNSAITIDILFVAFGFPKQEIWMSENLGKLPFRVAIGVGGAFDYIGGNVSRAPVFMRKLGLEWFYRLIRQPWRWKRQLALLEFGYMVLKERFKK